GPRLAKEALAHGRVVSEMRRQCLDRDLALEPRVTGEVDNAHSASTNLAFDLVLTGKCGGKRGEVAEGWGAGHESDRVGVVESGRVIIHYPVRHVCVAFDLASHRL